MWGLFESLKMYHYANTQKSIFARQSYSLPGRVFKITFEPSIAPFPGSIYNEHFTFVGILKGVWALPAIEGISGAQVVLFLAPNGGGSGCDR